MAKIIIELDTDNGDTLAKALAAIAPLPASGTKLDFGTVEAGGFVAVDTLDHAPETDEPRAAPVAPDEPRSEAVLSDMDGERKRGEAGHGHRRRTNAQIAADESYFEQKKRAEAALRKMDKGLEPAAISSGEERISPEDTAQDTLDEAAETAARAAPEQPTTETLRAVFARYIDKFGHAASVKNMRTIIGCAVADCPADEIANAIAKVEMAIAGSTVITPTPVDGKPVDGLFGDKPATATKQDVTDAIMAYGRKYDGSDMPEQMVITKEDLPKVFSATFGDGVTGMGSLPDRQPETLGKIRTAIQAAIETNPFKREAKS